MGARNYNVPRTLLRMGQLWVDGRQTGSYPETGLGENNGDLLEADFGPA
jgi:hypothetical protein